MMRRQENIETLRCVRNDVNEIASLLASSGDFDEVYTKARSCDQSILQVLSDLTSVNSKGDEEEMKSLIAETREQGQKNLEMIQKRIELVSEKLKQVSQSKKALASLKAVAKPARPILDCKL